MRGWTLTEDPAPGDLMVPSAALRRDVLMTRRENAEARRLGMSERNEEVVPLYEHTLRTVVDSLALGETALIVSVSTPAHAPQCRLCTVVSLRGRLVRCIFLLRTVNRQVDCFTRRH